MICGRGIQERQRFRLPAVRTKLSRRFTQQVQTSIQNIKIANIRDGLVDGNFPHRPLPGHHHNRCMLIWAGWLTTGKFADRHNVFVSKREGLAGPELDRCDPVRKTDTPGIDHRAHATFPVCFNLSARSQDSKERLYRLTGLALQMIGTVVPAFGSKVRRCGDRPPSPSPRRASWFPPPLGWQSFHPLPRHRDQPPGPGKP
jgi:hypothetical protein